MIREFLKDQKVLVVTGALSLAAFVVLTVMSLFDSFEILGINRWVKPMKFTLSVGVYLLTLAVYLYFIEGRSRAKKVICYGVSLLMSTELVLIIMQSARGTTSHFNIANGFDGMVFSIMGILIVINTALIFYTLYLYFKAEVRLPRAVLWGMRLGIILFLVSSFEGGYMSVILRHSVGVADGGPGLPFVNWSTEGGDLRAAHFIGMHALQVMPIAGYLFERLRPRAAVMLTVLSGVSYFLVFTAIFFQALAGRPLWAISI
jgi:hypothetical protein